MNTTEKRTKLILDYLYDKLIITDSCTHYGEPGYSDPEVGILFGNWNDVPKRIIDYLEEAGYELEWCDEWYVDYDNDKAWRTSPDSYHWVCQIAFTDDGDVLTPDDSISNWLDEMSIWDAAQTPRALPDWITENDLEEHGYQKYNGEFETGWHPGQTDDPSKIAAFLFEKSNAERVVFRINEQSQFYIVWEAYLLPIEQDDGGNNTLDGDHDSAMASAGFGTDEDYGNFNQGDTE